MARLEQRVNGLEQRQAEVRTKRPPYIVLNPDGTVPDGIPPGAYKVYHNTASPDLWDSDNEPTKNQAG